MLPHNDPALVRRVGELHTEQRQRLAEIIVREMGKPIEQALTSWHLKADDRAVIDYGFHMTITDLENAP